VLESKGEAVAIEIEEVDQQVGLKEDEIAKQNTQKVDFQMIREVLKNFSQVFSDLSPYEQQQTVRYLVDHVIYTDFEMKIALDAGTYVLAIKEGAQREFSEPPIRRAVVDAICSWTNNPPRGQSEASVVMDCFGSVRS